MLFSKKDIISLEYVIISWCGKHIILYLSKGLFYNTTFEELLIKKKKKKVFIFYHGKDKTGDADNLSYYSNRTGGCERSSMGLLAQAAARLTHVKTKKQNLRNWKQ
jgi:hypothetical protein